MQNSKPKLIKIGGAGISGLASAIVLAKAGYDVEVFERNEEVGKRFNGDFQGLMNWGFRQDALFFMKEIGIGVDFWNKPLKRLDCFGPDDYFKKFDINKPYVYLVKRGSEENCLDSFLKNRAVEEGVDIKFNTSVNPYEVDIIATGPNFDNVTDGMVLGYTFKSDSKDIYAMAFNDKLAYNGYSYFFIVNGYGTVATCVFGNYEKLSEYLKKSKNFFQDKYSFKMKGVEKFSGTGNFFLSDFGKNTKMGLHVGEAGGFQDFLFGFGMRYAMITGNLAARSIIENKKYTDLWRKELNDFLKTSVSNRFWFSLLRGFSYRMFIKGLSKKEEPLSFFDSIYKPNLLSKVTYPFAKLYFNKYIKDRRGGN